jgi:hypothetical protein
LPPPVVRRGRHRFQHLIHVCFRPPHARTLDATRPVSVCPPSAAGQRVVGETVTSALTLDESVLWHEDFATAAQYVMSPPIRAKHHQQPLQNALASGVLSLVGTGAAAYSEAHVANRDARVSARGDRKRVLERGTNPYLSRRACTCENGLQSWRGESAGVAKRPREPHLPPEIPTVTIRHFASLYVSPIRNKPRVRRRGLPCSRHPFPTAL